MNRGLLFVWKCTVKNKIKHAIRRPMTYVCLVGIIFYAVFLINTFGDLAETFHVTDGRSFVTLLSIGVFYLIPIDIISYTKRKGLLFRPSEVHMIFPAPVNPKQILLFAGIKSFLGSFILAVFVLAFGLAYFQIDWWRVILIFLMFGVIQNLMEGSIIVIFYGNERIPEKYLKVFTYILYGLMIFVTLLAVFMLCTKGLHFSVIRDFLELPVVWGIPLIGWIIAVAHLILIGPTMYAVLFSVCYVVLLVIAVVYALKMKCTGEYYEDAMTFADDYQQKMVKSKRGESVAFQGKKKYLHGVSINYKANYAKAIYYRQLLEYKKNRFFIFGKGTLLAVVLGAGIAVISYFTDLGTEMGAFKIFVIPGVMAYILFIFSGYVTKWSKELGNPYTFLIPDSGFHKLWHATKIEHIRALIDGIIITVPGSIALGIDPVVVLFTVLLYVCLSANKLYISMLSDMIIGNLLGNTGKTLFRTFFQGIAIAIGIVPAVLLGMFVGQRAGFLGMILVSLGITIGCAAIAALSFDKMERID